MAIVNYAPALAPYLTFLYRDNDIAVLRKPSGLLSVPGKAPEHKDSLQMRVLKVLPTATVIHRLDMATSGIMIFALNRQAHKHISKQFELRQIDKEYHALVFGRVQEDEGVITHPLICDWPNRPKQKIDYEYGKSAKTIYEVIERFDDYTWVRLKPVTGRSHQLRVHMLSLDHPILGDRLYAHPIALSKAQRLCLHARRIKFQHPVTLKPISFEDNTALQDVLVTD